MERIHLKEDDANEMRQLYLNEQLIASGNFWDYDFEDMISAIRKSLTILSLDYEYSTDYTWKSEG